MTSLSGADGMSLLAALLGMSGSSSPSFGGGGVVGIGGVGTGGGGGGVGGINGFGDGGGLAGLAGLGLGVLDDLPGSRIGGLGGGAAATTAPEGGGGIFGPGTTNNEASFAGSRPSAMRGTTTPRETEANFPRLAPLGSTRRILRRNNRPNSRGGARSRARLTEADVRVQDPGSVEPVRQGLMTLHTLLGNALLMQRMQSDDTHLEEEEEDNVAVAGVSSVVEHKEEEDEGEEEEEEKDYLSRDGNDLTPPSAPSQIIRQPTTTKITSPLDSHRQWYRGQWLDALDTVSQWLEATVVDIVLPSGILPNYTLSGQVVSDSSSSSYNARRTPNQRRSYRKSRRQTPDAVVSANDLEGRRRLLLEPRPESEAGEDEDGGGVYDLLDEGYRVREDNDGVQLLLIHYNGWPHRWDEWIRSDSERIRPFRTRTRHRNTVRATHAMDLFSHDVDCNNCHFHVFIECCMGI